MAVLAVHPADGQAQRTEVAPHPPAADEVVWSDAAPTLGIYRSSDELLFASDAGVRRVWLEGVMMNLEVSASGARIGVLQDEKLEGALELRVLTNEGVEEATFRIPQHGDDPLPQLALPDDGNDLVFARPATAELCFASRGAMECAALFKEATYTHERNVYVEFGPDGRRVAVAAQREAAHPRLAGARDNAFLFLFDRSGELLWRQALPQPAVRALAFSPDGSVAVSTYDAYAGPHVRQRSLVTSVEGEILAEAPHGADAFAFGADEILLISGHTVAAMNASDGSTRTIHDASPQRRIISAALGRGAGGAVLLTGRQVIGDAGLAYGDLRLLHIDEAGAVVTVDDVHAPPQRSPRVMVDDDRGRTALILDRETHFYARPR